MAKKKTSRSTSKKNSYGKLFDAHPNLLWLLPLFLVAVLVFFLAKQSFIPGF